jgi:hypothetical protein
LATKRITGVEIRFFSPIASLQGIDADRRVGQFNARYLLQFEDGSESQVAGNPARHSAVFNTPEFTRAVYDALSEFARNAESGTWCPPKKAA